MQWLQWMAQAPAVPWVAFGALVVALLCLDLFVFHRKVSTPTLAQSAGWTVFWIALAVAFNALVWYWKGPQAGVDFLTGYLVEKSLSMDNVFVFAVIFRFFHVGLQYQYRVLFFGILGAIILRLIFILAGAELVHRFAWVLPLFGLFLVYTGFKLAFRKDEQVEPGKNWVLRVARRWFPVSKHQHEHHFFVIEQGRRCVTPLFLVLLVIESSDVMFAVDSVPAIFGITKDAFIIFTSNIFAILGLRALYFMLASVIDRFRYLVFGLSAVLVFIGAKMVAEYVLPRAMPQLGDKLVPSWVSLVVVGSLIALSIVASLLAPRKEPLAVFSDGDIAPVEPPSSEVLP